MGEERIVPWHIDALFKVMTPFIALAFFVAMFMSGIKDRIRAGEERQRRVAREDALRRQRQR